MSARRLDAPGLRRWAHTAVAHLISHTDEINRLNVFPVADADTGTNMLFTMRAAWAQADAHAAVNDVAHLAAAMADGALRGARGNSGVILSQILRGIADVTAAAAEDRDGVLADIDGALFGAALRHAVTLVVASMGEAVPGTIVSVLQDAATAAEQSAADRDELTEVVAASAHAAAAALDRTPGQLDVLAEAGVVDAGGRGLLVLLDALTATLTGHSPQRGIYRPSPKQAQPVAATSSPPQFEVMYLLGDCRRRRRREAAGRLERRGSGRHRRVGLRRRRPARCGSLLGARPRRRRGRCGRGRPRRGHAPVASRSPSLAEVPIVSGRRLGPRAGRAGRGRR